MENRDRVPIGNSELMLRTGSRSGHASAATRQWHEFREATSAADVAGDRCGRSVRYGGPVPW